MKTVAIAGVGLIGASFGLALRRAGFTGPILGVSSPGAIADALACGAIDAGVPLEEALERADLVLLAQPILRIIDTLGRMAPLVRPGTLVTDAGSTKVHICAQGAALPPGTFLGGHPMAGKEVRGAAAGEAALFEGRTWVLTPSDPAELDAAPAREFRSWLERIGARILILSPTEHDAVVAITSHLPQMLSTTLGVTVDSALTRADQLLAGGPGLIDMTRLAMSSFEIWSDILATNTEPVRQALGRFIETLEAIRARIGDPSAEADFDRAAALARRLRES
jgi:prephenate dehydrogenase